MKIGPRIKQIGNMKTDVNKGTLNLTYFCRIFHNIKKINIQSPEQLALTNLNNSIIRAELFSQMRINIWFK